MDQQKEHENNTRESMKQICGKLETSLSIYAWGTAQDHALISMRIKCLENKMIPLLLE